MQSQKFNRRSTAEQVTEGLDLSGKHIVITGVTSGLGLESMRVLAMRGAHVIGLARSEQSASQACASVAWQTTPIACDLSDLDSVSAAAAAVLALDVPIDAVLCNAGIMALPECQLEHGLELQFLTNHLGHFLLLRLLQPCLAKADAARVVITSSDGHRSAPKGGIDFSNLSGDKGYSAWTAYGQSKLANILCANEMAKRWQADGIRVNSVHPGVIQTNLARHTAGLMSRLIHLFAPLFERSIPCGAATQVYLAVHPDCATFSGGYYADCQEKRSSHYGRDEKLAGQLWHHSEKLLHGYL